jgi:heme exporter protein C
MKWFRWIWLAGTLALLVEAFYQAMYVAPTEATMGNIQRIFYYHAPTAMLMFLFFFISFAASVAYLVLRQRDPLRAMSADALALAAAEVGVVFCSVVLMQGMLWARPVWGIWWTWDARLTSALILWLIYSSYLLLRRFAGGAQMQTLAAIVAIFGFADVPIVYYSTTWWRTQHPSRVVSTGNLDPSMWPPFLWNIAAWLAWGLMVMGLRYAIERRRQLREQDEALRALDASIETTPWKEND